MTSERSSDDSAPDRPERTFPRVRGQGRLATTAQLRDAGWSSAAILHASHRTIQPLYRGVFADHRGPIDDDARLVAAYLWAGPEVALLTGIGALRRAGLTVNGSDELLFLVPDTRRGRKVKGVRTQRTRRLRPGVRRVGCVPLAPIARALCDAARYQKLGGDNLRAATIAALQRDFTSPAALSAELAEGEPHPLLRGVEESVATFARGAWSLPEAALGEAVRGDPMLGAMIFNPRLETRAREFIGTPDGYLVASGVAVQVHSKRHHSGHDDHGNDQWSRTVEGDTAYPMHGIIVVGVTPNSLSSQPSTVTARLRRVVERAPARDLSHIVVRPQARDDPDHPDRR